MYACVSMCKRLCICFYNYHISVAIKPLAPFGSVCTCEYGEDIQLIIWVCVRVCKGVSIPRAQPLAIARFEIGAAVHILFDNRVRASVGVC